MPDTREEMLCNFILTKEDTSEEMLEIREELPDTREKICAF